MGCPLALPPWTRKSSLLWDPKIAEKLSDKSKLKYFKTVKENWAENQDNTICKLNPERRHVPV